MAQSDTSDTSQQLVASDPSDVQEVPATQEPPPNRVGVFISTFFNTVSSLAFKLIIIYFVTQLIQQYTGSKQVPTVKNKDGSVSSARQTTYNLFNDGSKYDLYVYVTDDPKNPHFDIPDALFWSKHNLIYGDWYGGDNFDGTFTHIKKFPIGTRVQNNGTIFLHAFATLAGKSPNPSDPNHAGVQMAAVTHQLNRYKKLKYYKTKNLLTGETDRDATEIEKFERGLKEEIISHWHPNLTLNIVTDQTNWAPGTVPVPLNDYIEFLPGKKYYKPVLFINDYWNLAREYQPINSTVKELELRLTLQPLSLFKWQIYLAQTSRTKKSFAGGMFDVSSLTGEENDSDQDTIKEMLLDTSPYLLAATVVVSILHSVFEMLAFKNDIQFWNNRKSLEGLSVRSVFFNVFQALIVLLYVLDNDTNFVVRVSCFIGLGIELWKINKVNNVKIDRENLWLGVFPRISLTDKGSYVESSTKQYDTMAFKYLSWLCFPLLIGYSIYSLMYLEHKGWYSFVLDMLYGFLLTFGFIMMTPQLFINYKMKSVAHLPWRMMSYKFLNTFVDDIFAFVIKMPTLHRLGCLRDDIVFFIFLYQRWIYKVDKTRVNEFGYSGDMDESNQVAIRDENQVQTEDVDEAKKDK